jgi:8-amino-7-oxononanoate synthase
VPQDSVIIRFALMATHSMEQLDEAIEKITKIFRQLEIIA